MDRRLYGDCLDAPWYCRAGIIYGQYDHAIPCDGSVDCSPVEPQRECEEGCADYLRTEYWSNDRCAEEGDPWPPLGPALGAPCAGDADCRWQTAMISAGMLLNVYRHCVAGVCADLPVPPLLDYGAPCTASGDAEVVPDAQCLGGACWVETNGCTAVCTGDDECAPGTICDDALTLKSECTTADDCAFGTPCHPWAGCLRFVKVCQPWTPPPEPYY